MLSCLYSESFTVLQVIKIYLLTYLLTYSMEPYECFRTGVFYGEALLAPRPTPNLEGQGIPFSLGHHL